MENYGRYLIIEEYLQECVDEDIYTEEYANQILELAYNKYIIERSKNAGNKLTPEESRRRWENLKKLGYDEKTKTIPDKHGGRVKVNFDRYSTNDWAEGKFLNGRNEKAYNQYKDMYTKKGNVKTSKLPKQKDPITGKVSIDQEKRKSIDDRGKGLENLFRGSIINADSRFTDSNRRVKNIKISENINKANGEIVTLHELGHKNAADKKRKYVNDTGLHTRTSSRKLKESGKLIGALLDNHENNGKQTLVKQNFSKATFDDDNPNFKRKNRYLDIPMDKLNKFPKEFRRKYLEEKDPKKRAQMALKAREYFTDNKSREYVKGEREAKKISNQKLKIHSNDHDRLPEELMADNFAYHHSNLPNSEKKMKQIMDKVDTDRHEKANKLLSSTGKQLIKDQAKTKKITDEYIKQNQRRAAVGKMVRDNVNKKAFESSQLLLDMYVNDNLTFEEYQEAVNLINEE